MLVNRSIGKIQRKVLPVYGVNTKQTLSLFYPVIKHVSAIWNKRLPKTRAVAPGDAQADARTIIIKEPM